MEWDTILQALTIEFMALLGFVVIAYLIKALKGGVKWK